MIDEMKLTEKQQMFVDEYIIDLNATQAAIRAGYSEKCARQVGNANMSKVYIQQEIQARSAEKKDNLVMKQDEILERNMSSWRNVMKRHLKSVVIMIRKCLKSKTWCQVSMPRRCIPIVEVRQCHM